MVENIIMASHIPQKTGNKVPLQWNDKGVTRQTVLVIKERTRQEYIDFIMRNTGRSKEETEYWLNRECQEYYFYEVSTD